MIPFLQSTLSPDDLVLALQFLRQIGVPLKESPAPQETFLPGVWIENSCLHYDRCHLSSVGDLLHEAGHWAITPSSFRQYWSVVDFYLPSGKFPSPLLPNGKENSVCVKLLNGCEQAVIAWSYAAAIATGIDPRRMHLPPHYDGYWNKVCTSLELGCHSGINNLSHVGLLSCQLAFPKLTRWIQE
jgi:hypothetical protein